MKRLLIGIDEAGRGPLAGPVAVGVVAVPKGYRLKKRFPGVADSKKLSPKKREVLFALLEAAAKRGEVSFVVEFSSASYIDSKGITLAVTKALVRGLSKMAPTHAFVAKVLLDGSLKAPPQYKQKTIIRGDATEPIISLASIAAKVVRDRHMVRLAKKFPRYGFDVHKGYGTKMHGQAIERFGRCPEHRRSFTQRYG
jgi:ribonuclease HII